MGPLRLKYAVLAFCLLSLGCSNGRPAPDADAAQGDATAVADAIAFADAPVAPPDVTCPLGTTAGIPLPIRVPCERGDWCWESPDEYGLRHSDGLVESPTSIWLAGSERDGLVHFDGTAWRVVRLGAAVPLTNFSDGLQRGRWVWGTRFVGANRETALFRRNSTGWEPASLPNHETPIAISEGDAGSIAVTFEKHVFVFARGATEWTDITPNLASGESPRNACLSVEGRAYVVSSWEVSGSSARLWKNARATSRDWNSTQLPSAGVTVSCPREGAALTVTRVPGSLDATGNIEITYWTESTRPTFARMRWTHRLVHLETSAGDTIVENHCWTPEGLIPTSEFLPGGLWADTDPTRRVTLTDETVAPRRSPSFGPPFFGAFDDDSLLFLFPPSGSYRVRNRSGEWRSIPRPGMASEEIVGASIASRNVVWVSQANGEIRRLEFDDNGALLRRGDAIPSAWTSAPSIAFDETDRGWLWKFPTNTVERWAGGGAAPATVRIGATASAITSDRHGGLWVITDDMHVRRCRDALCEDTGRVLPFVGGTRVTVQSATNETLWVRNANSGAFVALEVTGSPRVVFNSTTGPFYVASDGTAFVIRGNTIVRVRSDGMMLGEERIPSADSLSTTRLDALYATSAGHLWIRTEIEDRVASLRR